jgi:hypothetical protein
VASAQAVANPGGGALPPTADAHVAHIEAFAGHLQAGALSDDGVQGGTAPIPPPGGPQTALAASAQNPAAAKGIPERSDSDSTKVSGSATASGAPVHSLTPDYWDKSDQLMAEAVAAAARAGHDPDQTYAALNHMRTSFIQGHMLRNLSAANVALQNRDQAGVETALKAMNYYLPNGQNLNIQKDANGQLVYQNALQPYLDAQGNPTDSKRIPGPDGKMVDAQPNMIPVDAAHLQMLGQAVLDPMKVNDVLIAARSGAAKIQLEQAQAHGALMTGQGNELRGEAAVQRAHVQDFLSHSQAYKNTAEAQWWANRITAAAQQGGAKGDELAYKAGADSAKAVMDLQQGLPTTAPAMEPRMDPKTGQPLLGPDGKPIMVASMAPNAGRTMRDPTKVPVWLQGKTPDQIGQIASLASEIGAANRGALPAPKAAEIAGQIYSHTGTKHPGPDGKPEADIKYSKDRTQGWIWNGRGWDNFKASKRTISSLAGGNVDIQDTPPTAGAPSGGPQNTAATPGEPSGGAATPDNPLDSHEPADTETDEDKADDNREAQ